MKLLRNAPELELDYRSLFDSQTTRKPCSWEEVGNVRLRDLTADQLQALRSLAVVEVPKTFNVDGDLDWSNDYSFEFILTHDPSIGDRVFYYVNTEGYSYCRYIVRLLDVVDTHIFGVSPVSEETSKLSDPRDEIFYSKSIPVGDSKICVEIAYTVLGLPILKFVDTRTGTCISGDGIFAKHLKEAAERVAHAQDTALMVLTKVRDTEACLSSIEETKKEAIKALSTSELALLETRSRLRSA